MQVVEFEKHLVFRGLFEDPAAAEECAPIPPWILVLCLLRAQTTPVTCAAIWSNVIRGWRPL